jgi:RNA polymerase sigma factor (sigma-70 family)
MSSDPLDVLSAKEAREVVRGAVSRLSHSDRLCLRMVHLDGFSEDEIAECSAMSPGEVRSALQRALTLLRNSISGSGHGLPNG